jgi:hypothetical protein
MERLEHMRTGGQEVPELLVLPIYSTLPSDLQVSCGARMGWQAAT